MNSFIKNLRLYRIVTVLKIIPRFWNKSGEIAKVHKVSPVKVFVDMLGCLIKYGASEENYEQFHFFENDSTYRNSFITWRRNMDIMYKFCTPASKELFLDKVKWNERFAKYVKRDWLFLKRTTKKQFIDFLNVHPIVIVKTIDGACGKGIRKYNSTQILDDHLLLNSIMNEGSIVEEVAINSKKIREFNSTSLNTLRFVTCIDQNGKPQIIATAMRMGSGTSFTDNIVTGGIACYIDSETGKICTNGMNVKGKFFDKHPKSGITFKGFQIPYWNECVETVKALALEVPEARFVGWDVVLTEKGIDILEGNIPPGEELTELNLKGKYKQVMDML